MYIHQTLPNYQYRIWKIYGIAFICRPLRSWFLFIWCSPREVHSPQLPTHVGNWATHVPIPSAVPHSPLGIHVDLGWKPLSRFTGDLSPGWVTRDNPNFHHLDSLVSSSRFARSGEWPQRIFGAIFRINGLRSDWPFIRSVYFMESNSKSFNTSSVMNQDWSLSWIVINCM